MKGGAIKFFISKSDRTLALDIGKEWLFMIRFKSVAKKSLSLAFGLSMLFSYGSTYVKAGFEKDLDYLTGKIDEVQNTIKCTINSKLDTTRVIIIGPTGSGKSTLSNMLCGKEMFARKGSGGRVVVDTRDSVGSGIGHSVVSETELPSVHLDTSNSLLYCDCPGFFDNSGGDKTALQEIINTYSISSLFQKPNNIKIILVFGDNDLDTRANCARDAFDRVYQLFQNNKEELEKSLSLAITKCDDDVTVDDYLEILSEGLDKGSSAYREFVNFFSKHKDRVFLFPKPKKSQIDKRLDFVEKERLLGFLKSKSYGQCSRDLEIEPTIDARETVYLSELGVELLTQHNSSLEKCKENTKKFVDSCNDLKVIEGLQSNMKCDNANIVKFIGSIKDINGLGSLKDLLEKFKLLFKYQEFLNALGFNTEQILKNNKSTIEILNQIVKNRYDFLKCEIDKKEAEARARQVEEKARNQAEEAQRRVNEASKEATRLREELANRPTIVKEVHIHHGGGGCSIQ